jgi:myo-inositol 2-dehydrogenase/D-chiro-inositol 1-dehydrogenase
MAPLKVGLVGCGRLAERGWIPALRLAGAAGTAKLVALAEPDAGRREAAARAAGLDGGAAFADWRELIEPGRADALVLALGGHAQVEPATAASAAGLRVLVEKPPGGDRAGAEALAALSPAPAVGFSRRFDPAWSALRDAARQASPPYELELRLSYRRTAWAPHVVGDDALADLGSHVIDLAAWIAGAPVARARCRSLEPLAADGELELAGGIGAARFTVDQESSYAELGRLAGSAAAVRRGGAWRNALSRFGAGPDAAALPRSLHGELAALARPGEDLATAEDGVRCHAALEALRASAAAGGVWVEVE